MYTTKSVGPRMEPWGTPVSYKTHNHPKPATTTQNQPQPSKTSQTHAQPAITTQNFAQKLKCTVNLLSSAA